MAGQMGNIGSVAAAAAEGSRLNAPSTGTAQTDGGTPNDPKFGDVLKKIQSQYGAKAEKPREIKKTLGKDDFLRIMITQMKNQDPTNPFKAEQMAAEMAQFTSVEQMQNMNRSLEKMASNDRPAERLAMTSLIGKTVTVDRNRFPHTEGSNEALVYVLPKDASEVRIALVSEQGEVVLEKDIGKQKAGEGTFSWDGLKKNSLPAKSGSYLLRVEAKDENGNSMDTSAQSKARVIGLSFEGSEPVFLVGDAKNQAKVTMKNIVRIDEAFGAPAAAAMPAAQPEGAPTSGMQTVNPAAQGSSPNFIAFQKGVGSSNLDPSQASPEVAAALAQYAGGQSANAASSEVEKNVQNEEKGFPNGLQD